jgi:hypothetical protein
MQTASPSPTLKRALTTILPGVLLLIIGTACFLATGSQRRLASTPAMSSLGPLYQAEPGSTVLLAGRVSEMMRPIEGTYAAYVRTSGGQTDARTPQLLIDLADGPFQFSNTDYEPVNWPQESGPVGEYRYLEAGDAVVVSGTVEHWTTELGTCEYVGHRSAEFLLVRAERVFAGTYEEYAAQMRRTALWPRVITWAGWATGVIVIAVPAIVRRVRLARSAARPDNREGG